MFLIYVSQKSNYPLIPNTFQLSKENSVPLCDWLLSGQSFFNLFTIQLTFVEQIKGYPNYKVCMSKINESNSFTSQNWMQRFCIWMHTKDIVQTWVEEL